MKKRKILKRISGLVIALFIMLNLVAAFHAYTFTHFSNTAYVRPPDPKKLSFTEKIKALFLGVKNPRPVNDRFPAQPYTTIKIPGAKETEGWLIKTDSAKGTVVLFHGYGGNKSSLLDRSNEFLDLGFNTLLVDFMGSGGSEGNQTTIGYKEAEQVKSCFNYLKNAGDTSIFLSGNSMGAVAILKCLHDNPEIQPAGVILECPFGSMYQTVCARFNMMHAPAFPMAGLLVFWGGIENGFWAFGHNPVDYAKKVNCPVLLLYGEQDDRVSRKEIDCIYQKLQGEKKLKTYPLAGHESYLDKYKNEWKKDVAEFLFRKR